MCIGGGELFVVVMINGLGGILSNLVFFFLGEFMVNVLELGEYIYIIIDSGVGSLMGIFIIGILGLIIVMVMVVNDIEDVGVIGNIFVIVFGGIGMLDIIWFGYFVGLIVIGIEGLIIVSGCIIDS